MNEDVAKFAETPEGKEIEQKAKRELQLEALKGAICSKLIDAQETFSDIKTNTQEKISQGVEKISDLAAEKLSSAKEAIFSKVAENNENLMAQNEAEGAQATDAAQKQEKPEFAEQKPGDDSTQIEQPSGGIISAAGQKISETTQNLKENIGTKLTTAKDTVVETFVHAKDVAKETLTAAKDTIVHAKDVAADKISAFAETVKETAIHPASLFTKKAEEPKQESYFNRVEDAIDYITQNTALMTNELKAKVEELLQNAPSNEVH